MAIGFTCRDNDKKLYQAEGHSILTNATNTPYQTSSENEWQWFSPQVRSEWQSDQHQVRWRRKIENEVTNEQSAATKNTLRNTEWIRMEGSQQEQSESETKDRNLKTKPVHHQRGTPTICIQWWGGYTQNLHLARGYTFSHIRLPYYSSKGAGRHFYFYSNHPGKAAATLITKLQSRKHNSTFQLQIHFQSPKEMPNALQNNTKELLTSKGGLPPLSDAKVLLYLQGCVKIFGSAQTRLAYRLLRLLFYLTHTQKHCISH